MSEDEAVFTEEQQYGNVFWRWVRILTDVCVVREPRDRYKDN